MVTDERNCRYDGIMTLRLGLSSVALLGALLQAAPQAQEEATRLKLLSLMPRDLQNCVKVTNAPTLVFHWSRRPTSTPLQGVISARDPSYLRYITPKVQDFKRLDHHYGNSVGRGLYAALDPVASRDYGGRKDPKKKWMLSVIHLPSGFKTLDSLGPCDLPFQADTLLLLKSYCPLKTFVQKQLRKLEYWPQDFSIRYLLTQSSEQGPRCRALINDVLEGMKISGIFYKWSATRFAQCPSHRGKAGEIDQNNRALYIREIPRRPDGTYSIDVYTQEGPRSADAIFFNALALQENPRPQGPTLLPLWKSLGAPPTEALAEWSHKNILGCREWESYFQQL